MTRKLRLPRSLVFPLDYRVKLVWQDHDEFCEEHGDHGVAFFEFTEKPGGTMYLDRSRSIADLLEDLEHELGHALVEWQEHWQCYWKQRLKELMIGPAA